MSKKGDKVELVGAEELPDAPPAYDAAGYALPTLQPARGYGVQPAGAYGVQPVAEYIQQPTQPVIQQPVGVTVTPSSQVSKI